MVKTTFVNKMAPTIYLTCECVTPPRPSDIRSRFCHCLIQPWYGEGGKGVLVEVVYVCSWDDRLNNDSGMFAALKVRKMFDTCSGDYVAIKLR